jgi:hypothetical protein
MSRHVNVPRLIVQVVIDVNPVIGRVNVIKARNSEKNASSECCLIVETAIAVAELSVYSSVHHRLLRIWNLTVGLASQFTGSVLTDS